MRAAAPITRLITAVGEGLLWCVAACLPVPAISARARTAKRQIRDRPVWHGALT
jgi:hypothetical protein